MAQLLTDKLNPAQQEAVETLRGPLLILAGAGSGKTRVLTYRMTNLIAQGEAAPNQILAVTFTNKAAREMQHRIVELLHSCDIPVHAPMWISTFHSACVRILREHIHLLGYQPFFGIYDTSDQLSVIKKTLEALRINDKTYPPKLFAHMISQAKMRALSPDDVAQRSLIMDEQALDVYRRYEDEMKRANSLDFDDLLLKTLDLFRSYPDVLDGYRDLFQFVMVDEYQDTNHIQYQLTKLLSETHRNLCVVGDEDQSIYSWRGADIANILSFERDFPDGKVIKLEENYRSSGTIVQAASSVIRNNSQRKDKTLFTSNPLGEKIRIREEASDYDEARFVARTIRDLVAAGHQPENVAIFYRTNAQSRVLEEQLRMNGTSYRIVGGLKFYERMEVKDVLCYFKLLLNPADDVAFKRIVNTPTRGIGKTSVEKLEEISARERIPLLDAISRAVQEKIFNSGTTKKLVEFGRLISDMAQDARQLKTSDLYHLILDKTQYAVRLKEENTPESLARLENLEELDNAINQFEQERGQEASVQTFLEEMALVSDADDLKEDRPSVTMMTLHISKGLEFPVVFIVGLEEGLFPSGRAIGQNGDEDVEEERRLMYVGMTRAREKLLLTWARHRKVWGVDQNHTASRFLSEIPESFVDREGQRKSDFLSRHAGIAERAPVGRSAFSRSTDRHRPFGDEAQVRPDFETDDDTASLRKGMRVRHPTFGVGSIFEVDGRGEDTKVSVVFSGNVVKKFVAKYARLERL